MSRSCVAVGCTISVLPRFWQVYRKEYALYTLLFHLGRDRELMVWVGWAWAENLVSILVFFGNTYTLFMGAEGEAVNFSLQKQECI